MKAVEVIATLGAAGIRLDPCEDGGFLASPGFLVTKEHRRLVSDCFCALGAVLRWQSSEGQAEQRAFLKEHGVTSVPAPYHGNVRPAIFRSAPHIVGVPDPLHSLMPGWLWPEAGISLH